MQTKSSVSVLQLSWQVVGFVLVAAAVSMIPDLLYAQTAQNSNVGNSICWIADNFEGNAGRGIATIGISTIGILALIGRVTWTQAIVVGTGCSVIFGAPELAASFNSGGTTCP